MNNFLICCKKQFIDVLHSLSRSSKIHSEFNKVIHVVLGNNSCDLDSFTCAVTHAWHRTKNENGVCLYVPIINIQRHLFRLRTEIVFLVDTLGISADNLVFLDDVNFEQLAELGKERFHVTMVDHNDLPRDQAFLHSFVTKIIDHHLYSEKECDAAIEKNIAVVGSCSTLVAEEMLIDTPVIEVPDQIQMLLLSAILVDTCQFSEQVGKTTTKDVNVFQKLRTNRTDSDIFRLYDNLERAKYSVKGLSTNEILIKDPKYVESDTRTILFSTLHEPQEKFLERPDAFDCVHDYCCMQNFCAWISLAPKVVDADKQYKPITLYSTDDNIREKVAARLISSSLDVKKSPDSSTSSNVVFFRMYDCKSSRKQVLPVVKQALEELVMRNELK